MEEYKAYFIGSDGHVIHRIDLICESEDVARERARQLVDRQPVELWQVDRLIARFEPTH